MLRGADGAILETLNVGVDVLGMRVGAEEGPALFTYHYDDGYHATAWNATLGKLFSVSVDASSISFQDLLYDANADGVLDIVNRFDFFDDEFAVRNGRDGEPLFSVSLEVEGSVYSPDLVTFGDLSGDGVQDLMIRDGDDLLLLSGIDGTILLEAERDHHAWDVLGATFVQIPGGLRYVEVHEAWVDDEIRWSPMAIDGTTEDRVLVDDARSLYGGGLRALPLADGDGVALAMAYRDPDDYVTEIRLLASDGSTIWSQREVVEQVVRPSIVGVEYGEAGALGFVVEEDGHVVMRDIMDGSTGRSVTLASPVGATRIAHLDVWQPAEWVLSLGGGIVTLWSEEGAPAFPQPRDGDVDQEPGSVGSTPGVDPETGLTPEETLAADDPANEHLLPASEEKGKDSPVALLVVVLALLCALMIRRQS